MLRSSVYQRHKRFHWQPFISEQLALFTSILQAAAGRAAALLRDSFDFGRRKTGIVPFLLHNQFVDALLCILVVLLFTDLKGGVIADQMRSVIIPVAVISLVLVFILDLIGASRMLIGAVSFLVSLGVLLQGLLVTYAPDADGAPVTNGNYILLSLVVALVLGWFLCAGLTWLRHIFSHKQLLLVLSASVVLLYLLLLVFGRRTGGSVNGAILYLSFGPRFHIPMLASFLSSLLLAGILSKDAAFLEQDIPLQIALHHKLVISGDTIRFTLSLVVMAVNTLCLALVSELGTLILLWLVYLALIFVSLPKRFIAALLVVLFVGLYGALGLSRASWEYCYNHDYAQARLDTVMAVEKLDPAKVNAAEDLLRENPKNRAETLPSWDLRLKLSRLHLKLQNRLHAEQNSQLLQAQKAMLLGGFFGSSTPSYVSVLESDFIYVLICLKLGVFGGIVTILVFCMLLVAGYATSCRAFCDTERLICIVSATSLFLHALISAGSASGILPTIGIGMPFLSQGSSANTIAFAHVFLIAFAGRHLAFRIPFAKLYAPSDTSEKEVSV